MTLTEKLARVGSEAKAIRESLTIHDPRNNGFVAQDEGLSRYDRMVGAESRLPRVMEMAKIFSEVFQGARPDWHVRESMTTSDFPLLFGDLLYRQMLGNYNPWPITYTRFCKIIDVRDFRTMNMYTLEGMQGRLDKVTEREPYKEAAFREGQYTLSVAKYGRRYSVTFEMMINDDLNAFQDRPRTMALGARRSEEYLATSLLVDVNGPHASFFTSGNHNIITGNPALSIAALQTAMKVLAAQTDADGEPIVVDAVELIVTPADEITAQNILNAIQIRVAEAGGTSNELLYVNNWMKGRVTLTVNPYLKTIASSLNSNPWFLVANPNSGRPAFMFGFLRGRREPQLFVKDPDAILLGGGESSPLEGNFHNDSIDYKIRHIFGAAQGDPKMAVASNGSGS